MTGTLGSPARRTLAQTTWPAGSLVASGWMCGTSPHRQSSQEAADIGSKQLGASEHGVLAPSDRKTTAETLSAGSISSLGTGKPMVGLQGGRLDALGHGERRRLAISRLMRIVGSVEHHLGVRGTGLTAISRTFASVESGDLRKVPGGCTLV